MAAKVEFYRIACGLDTWHYTSADRDIVIAPDTWRMARGLSRGSTKLMGSVKKSDLEITVPRDHEMIELFIVGRPAQIATVTLFKGYMPSPTPQMFWKGRIVGTSIKNNGTGVLSCESVFTSLARPGLRAMYQITCRAGLYQFGCNLERNDWRVTREITDVNGVTLTVDGLSGTYPNGYFTGGYVVDGQNYAMITGHSGNTVIVDRAIIGTGDAHFFPGCDHTRETCNDKFNNILNYRGFPWIPVRTPFAGGESFIPGGTVGA